MIHQDISRTPMNERLRAMGFNQNNNDSNKPERPQGPVTPKPGQRPPVPNARALLLYALIILLGVAAIYSFVFKNGQDVTELPTSEFVTAVKLDRVKEATYQTSSGKIEGKYWQSAEDVGNDDKLVAFTSTYVGVDSLAELMQDHPNVKYEADVHSYAPLWNAVSLILPVILIIVALIYVFNKFQGPNSDAMKFSKTKAKRDPENRPNVKFKDVAGIDEVVEELQEIKEFLVDPERFQKLGAKIPRGVLLVGPPGTGKTLIAKAVAGEAGVPFFSISGSDFVELYVGVGASRVRDLFKEAKASAPSIIFIDEIDAVGRQRGAGLGGGHDEREQTLNQLLVEMDGFDENESVILIAATNRPDILDPALLRPGRFDRQVTVDRPDIKGRAKILAVHAENKPLEPEVDFDKISSLTIGFTGADLANLMNEAALLAARRNKAKISMTEITESMERVIAGPERKSRVITDQEKRTIAYHECGHALVGHLLNHANPVHKISIIARGMALGYTLQMPEEDRYLKTRNEILDELAVFMGGRVAEEIFCDDITTGASNDLERSTKMAREMVTRYGFSEALGTQVYGQANHEVFLGRDYADHQDYSEATAERIDMEVNRIMQEAHDRAYKILSERKDQIEQMVAVILERETVEGDDVKALLDNRWDEYQAQLQGQASDIGGGADTKQDSASSAMNSEGVQPSGLQEDCTASDVTAAPEESAQATDAQDHQQHSCSEDEKDTSSTQVIEIQKGSKGLEIHEDGSISVYDHKTGRRFDLGPLNRKK